MPDIDHTKNIIEVKNVSFRYSAEFIIDDVSFDVHRGDYLGIIGPNGAGKTTLLKLMLDLLTPTQGLIKLFGKPVKSFKEWPKIGYVPQRKNFDQHFPATVNEVVLMGRFGKRGLFHRTTEEDHAAVTKALDQVDMSAFRDRLIGDLSGGEQQRVFIARALVSEPEVIFLDEPTTGIDRKTHDAFYALLKTLNRGAQLTLVLISHDIETVEREAMHIACVNRKLTYFGSPEQFIEESKTRNVFGEEVFIAHHHEETL